MRLKLIEKKRLSNNMVLAFFDLSRKVAADRWFMQIRCEAAIPLAEDLWGDRLAAEPELRAAVQRKMGESLTFSVTRERNFVAEQEKDDILAGLVGQVRENMELYLANPVFPQKLFDRQVREYALRCRAEQHLCHVEDPEEDNGPADFSHCFRE